MYLVFFFVFFSLFQSGSLQLTPVSIEITYGLERILMLLQVALCHSFVFSFLCSSFSYTYLPEMN